MSTVPDELRVSDLSLDYKVGQDRVHALVGVDLTVATGESLAVIGESGSGKSTLGKAIAGLSPANSVVLAGAIELTRDGRRTTLTGLPEAQLRRLRWAEIAYVPQAAINAFNPVMRVGDHFAETAREHRALGRARARARSRHLLDSVGLDPDRTWLSFPHELSGGMRQRALIALAMLLEPRYLILDEPTTALDVINQAGILQLLTSLKAQGDTSIVFISHDLAVASQIADRVVTMYAGRAVETGPTAAMTRESCRHPYTHGLFKAIPSLRGAPAVSIPGSPPDLRLDIAGCPFAPRCDRATDLCTRDYPTESAEATSVHCHHPLTEER